MRDHFKPDISYDLLRSKTFLSLSADPSILRMEVEALPPGSRVLVDEIQKLPGLLDEIHAVIFDFDDSYQFALTGSSARKLKKAQANLLAGRAVRRAMFPLTMLEMADDFNLDSVLQFGSLPRVVGLKSAADRRDYLLSYVETYLKEEIQQEAAVRNLPSYHRFLKHAARMNGQVVNLSNISREASVARSTLDGYFSILEDTLLGIRIEPLHLRAKVKEVSSPKFYFFDCGVVRALSNELSEPLGASGFLLETFMLNELRAYSSYARADWDFHYWGTPSANEVDFIIVEGRRKIGIEVKSSRSWKREFSKGLNVLLTEKKIDRAVAVYTGMRRLKDGAIDVFPVDDFCRYLQSGKL